MSIELEVRQARRTFAWEISALRSGGERLRAFGIVVAALASAVVASPSFAQVMEISPEGTVSVREGSGAVTWHGINDAAPGADVTAVGDVPAVAITAIDRQDVPTGVYGDMLQRAAADAGISPALLSALVWQESRWNPGAVSPKGAIGLTQLMPGTARDLGVDARDPAQNLRGGARYLRQLLDAFDGDVEKALAAYNAGPNRVFKLNRVPPIKETQKYVASIVQRLSSTQARGLK